MNIDELQLTPAGVDRFWELAPKMNPSLPAIRLEDFSELASLLNLIWLHPLGYPQSFNMYRKTAHLTDCDYESLVEKGFAKKVSNRFEHLQGLLVDNGEEDLLHVFETYHSVVRQKPFHDSDVMMAIEFLEKRAQEDSDMLRYKGDSALVFRMNEAKKAINPSTAEQWSIVLDAMIQQIHFDPDLLRMHDKNTQSIICAAVVLWLDQLAGKDSVKRWTRFSDMEKEEIRLELEEPWGDEEEDDD